MSKCRVIDFVQSSILAVQDFVARLRLGLAVQMLKRQKIALIHLSVLAVQDSGLLT